MLHCILVFRRNADTESAKACRIEWLLANFVPFKVCRFLSACPHGLSQEPGCAAVLSGKGLPLYRDIAGRCIDEGDSNTDTGVGYLSVWAALQAHCL